MLRMRKKLRYTKSLISKVRSLLLILRDNNLKREMRAFSKLHYHILNGVYMHTDKVHISAVLFYARLDQG
jgi:hypothetical protein